MYFDPLNYSALQAVPAVVNDDWDVLVVQPDASVPFPGLYDALALVDVPSTVDPFRVEFTWSGLGRPGSQAYDTHDAAFTVVQSGVTQAVPAPSSVMLLLQALAALALARRWRAR